jgi:hydroxymethylglutaryl-CoA lyase
MLVFPKQVQIVEVGPRDGFQNIKTLIATEVKLRVIEDMIAAGVQVMEVTSFVHPKAIPQMVDAAEIAKTIVVKAGDRHFNGLALVPNLTGAKKAYECGIREVTYVISASEQHNLANINRTREQSLADLQNIVTQVPEMAVRLDVATAFGCPLGGKVDEKMVLSLIESALKIGVKSVILCDTIGVANPKQVFELAKTVTTLFAGVPFGLHLHDTRGMGLANTLAGLEAGITTFESSIGGLGGCPFAPGAAGNTATEDLVNMFHGMGIPTGIDLDQYLAVVQIVRDQIQSVLTGHMAYARKYDEL